MNSLSTKVNLVRVRRNDNEKWEDWNDWKFFISNNELIIYHYTLRIGGWGYWINVTAWEFQ